MFSKADSFNGDISSWNVSSIENMSFMFNKASIFNQNLSRWNVSKVTDMDGMFQVAVRFNGDISSWNELSPKSITSQRNTISHSF
jgi:surface protein